MNLPRLRGAALKILVSLFLLAGCNLVHQPTGNAKRIIGRVKSAISEIIVYEEGKLRCFYFAGGRNTHQSCMNLANESKVDFEYIRMMFAAGTLRKKQGKVLVLGLGGGTLVKLFQKFYPGTAIDVVDLDPGVYEMAKKYFAFKPKASTGVFIMDAYDFVLKKARARAPGGYDMIFVDCFDANYIPPKLRSRPFIQGLRNILGPGGILAANVFTHHRQYDAMLWDYQQLFSGLWVMHGKTSGNTIILGTRAPGVVPSSGRVKHASAERIRLKVPFPLGEQIRKLVPLVAPTAPGAPATKNLPPGTAPPATVHKAPEVPCTCKDPCRGLAGRWTGQLRSDDDDDLQTHYLDGVVRAAGKGCSARFTVRFSTAWVVEHFAVISGAGHASFIGTRIGPASSSDTYNLDSLAGKLHDARTSLSGRWSSLSGDDGSFLLHRRDGK